MNLPETLQSKIINSRVAYCIQCEGVAPLCDAALSSLSAFAIVFWFAHAGGSLAEHLLHGLALLVYVPVCSYGMLRTPPTTGLAHVLHTSRSAAHANAGKQKGKICLI